MELYDNVSSIKGIGKVSADLFKQQNIISINDLIKIFPKKYNIYNATNYFDAQINDKITIKGVITSNIFVKKYHKNVNLMGFSFNTSNMQIRVVMFGNIYSLHKLKKGDFAQLFGTKKENNGFSAIQVFTDNFDLRINPIYGIKDIKDSLITKSLLEIENIFNKIEEEIPNKLLDKYRLLYNDAFYSKMHFPKTLEDVRQVNRKYKYVKYYKYIYNLKKSRDNLENYTRTSLNTYDNILDSFIKNLPYELTNGQKDAISDIKNDFKSNRVMKRLIQGDVGSGKTIIAVIACIINYLNNKQSVILAPTTILANQHYNNFKELLKSFNINIRLLNKTLKKSEKIELLEDLKTGKIDILVSTHAILYQDITFYNFGLYIVDEEHRFGVSSREMLLVKNKTVDSIYLSATPIPRTLGLTKYGNFDISTIKDKVKERKIIKTSIVSSYEIDKIINNIDLRVKRNEQAYLVVSVINALTLPYFDIDELKNLIDLKLPNIRYGILHGDLKDEEKNEVMIKFMNHELDIIISTTVIEVGVDVRNATGIYIFDADRFGLSTLHQLRGRVGRNNLDSEAFLITKDINSVRLNYLANTTDCFQIADFDLKMRGPGDLLGNIQSGFLDYDFENDGKIFECAKNDVEELFNNK